MKTIVIILALTFVVGACVQKSNKKQSTMDKIDLNQKHQPIQKMSMQEYWRIIELSSKESNGSEEEQMEILQEQLKKYSPEDILEFIKIEAKLMSESNHYNVMYAYAIIHGMKLCDAATDKFYVSEDGFLYFRLWLMHQGEKTFTETLKNPDYLADKVNPSDEIWHEMIAGIGIQTYMEKTGSYELPESFLPSIYFDETIKGTRYPVKELREKFPKLWSKFML